MLRVFPIVAILSFFMIRVASAAPFDASGKPMPGTFIWAWETATNLSDLPSDGIGVAFLAATVEGRSTGTSVRMRRATLVLPKQNLALLPVVRVHSFDRHFGPSDSESLETIVDTARRVLRDFKTARLQLDFDARSSERPFYQELVKRIRDTVCPAEGCFLSVTALASWCMPGDVWMSNLPVDEVVPMAFTLGPMFDRSYVIEQLASAPPPCHTAIGVWQGDEGKVRAGRRVYVFGSGAWNADAVAKVLRNMGSMK